MTLSLKHILIVDDQPAILAKWQKALEDHCNNVITASNGVKALEICDTIHPDLIVSDLDMPLIDGFEFIKLLKANPNTSQVPVIICSSTKDIASEYLCLSLGAIAYLEKPLKIDALFKALEQCTQQLSNVA